jgi:hypothetical protein
VQVLACWVTGKHFEPDKPPAVGLLRPKCFCRRRRARVCSCRQKYLRLALLRLALFWDLSTKKEGEKKGSATGGEHWGCDYATASRRC